MFGILIEETMRGKFTCYKRDMWGAWCWVGAWGRREDGTCYLSRGKSPVKGDLNRFL